MRVTVIGMIHIYVMYIMNIVLVNIYFQYIMLKFINSCDAHVQHLLLTNIPFSDKNEVDSFDSFTSGLEGAAIAIHRFINQIFIDKEWTRKIGVCVYWKLKRQCYLWIHWQRTGTVLYQFLCVRKAPFIPIFLSNDCKYFSNQKPQYDGCIKISQAYYLVHKYNVMNF